MYIVCITVATDVYCSISCTHVTCSCFSITIPDCTIFLVYIYNMINHIRSGVWAVFSFVLFPDLNLDIIVLYVFINISVRV